MKKKISGFTLIELLIVISIIAILAALAIFGIGNVFEKSRNTQRKSDIRQYQNALETFANNHDGLYPARVNDVGHPAADGLCTNDLQLDGCPDDPLFDPADVTVWRYFYETGGDTGGGCNGLPAIPCFLDADYVMWAQLEPEVDNVYWVICSNGESGEQTGTPSGTDGICPL